jgi:hypothetical protein
MLPRMAVIGLRVHSGWAAAVLVSGKAAQPQVLGRRRLVLVEGRMPRQPYHYVEEMGVEKARSLLDGWQKTVLRLARGELKEMTADHDVSGIAILLSSGRPLPELGKILASHALIHSAEGEFYRDALRAAGEALSLTVFGVKEKELFASASQQLKSSPEKLKAQLDSFKQSVGTPWTADEKLATLAAWLQLPGHALTAPG